MAKFIPGIDASVRSAEPLLEVLASPSAPLGVGRQSFQLVVTDNAGNVSSPETFTVVVQDPARPNAVIDFVRDDGTRIHEPVVAVPYGKPFRLTGDRSTDANGAVRVWTWTLIPR